MMFNAYKNMTRYSKIEKSDIPDDFIEQVKRTSQKVQLLVWQINQMPGIVNLTQIDNVLFGRDSRWSIVALWNIPLVSMPDKRGFIQPDDDEWNRTGSLSIVLGAHQDLQTQEIKPHQITVRVAGFSDSNSLDYGDCCYALESIRSPHNKTIINDAIDLANISNIVMVQQFEGHRLLKAQEILNDDYWNDPEDPPFYDPDQDF